MSLAIDGPIYPFEEPRGYWVYAKGQPKRISNLKLEAEGISRQLRAWTDSLQNSEIKGQRYLCEREKKPAKSKREKEEILEMLGKHNRIK
ncbi:MAG: hypothetical protein AB1480_06850 [Nitrospirota bacterium]